MKLEQAARQALEALKEYRDTQMIQAPRKAITALREALAEQAEQEPVAWIDNKTWCFTYSQYEYEDLDDDMTDDLVPLYTAPVRTKDLTENEIANVVFSIVKDAPTNYERTLCRAVIAADREKNRGAA